jgi:hypothetical protein
MGVLISLLLVSLTISSPAFATDDNSSYSDEKSFLSFFGNLFDALFCAKSYAKYDKY